MSLKDLNIRDTYSSNTKDGNLVRDFYNPVIEQAISYDRITGFFSPSVLAVASRGFANLISTGGKIRLISSVQVDDNLYQTVSSETYKFDDDFINNFDIDSLKTEIERDYLSVFAWLYQNNQLEMKIAITNKDRSMMHQKIGIVTDREGDSISFSGSNNETPNGWRYNIEKFNVFKSWNPHTISYFESDREEFNTLWNNLSSRAKVVNIDNAIKDKLVIKISKKRKGSIKDVAQRIKQTEHINRPRISHVRGQDKHFFEQTNIVPTTNKTNARSLHPYQEEAIKHWVDNNYVSIFEMATGTGKTYTTINALKEFGEKNNYLRAIVVVPLTTLTLQWQKEIQELLPDYRIINTSVDNDWRRELHSLHVSKLLNGECENFIIITSYKMYPTDSFLEAVSKITNDYILVADEMHNLVTDRCILATQNIIFKYKLGLSATPTRLWRPEESAYISRLFGDNSFSYDLKNAIDAKILVPYNYHAVFSYMDAEEYKEYCELSKTIAKMYASSESKRDNTQLNSKLIERARLKKNTSSKIPELSKLITRLDELKKLHHALIYVDNEEFLSSLQIMLSEKNIITTKFVGSTTLDERIKIIKNLRDKTIKAIVAIKCLDEGVDIPSAQSAFFLSNNTDPREYVQRLGRVLRQDKEGGKSYADVYDFIVLPPSRDTFVDNSSREIARNLIKNELIRSKFFQELAINGTETRQGIEDKIDEYGFVFEEHELEYNQEEQE